MAKNKERYLVGWCGRSNKSLCQVYGYVDSETGVALYIDPIKSLRGARKRANDLGIGNRVSRAIFRLELIEKID